MWIRSQDKHVLCYCKEVYLGEEYDDYTIENDKWVLGTYSTKEKALKVLDRITSFIMAGYYDIVFQMPQDDEVE